MMVRKSVIMLLIHLLAFHLAKAAVQELTEEDVLKEPKEDCSLNNHALYPWVVKIWDLNRGLASMHGAILGYLAVMTTCDKHLQIDSPHFYHVMAQRLLSTQHPGTYENTCSQRGSPVQILPHPSCVETNAHGKRSCQKAATNVFCFVVMVLSNPFHVVRNDNPDTAYPTFYFPKSPLQLLMQVRYVNTEPNSGCMLPIFYERFVGKPAFLSGSYLYEMKSIPYHTECVPLNCEHEEKSDFPLHNWRRKRQSGASYIYNADSITKQDCITVHENQTRHGLRLCVYPSWTSRLESFDSIRETNFYGGATLTCSGTVYGMVRPEKGHMHRVADSHFRQDYFVVTTFLRIFPWLVQMKDRFTAPWIETKFTDLLGMPSQHIREPEKPEGGPPDLVLSLSVLPEVHVLIFYFQLLFINFFQ